MNEPASPPDTVLARYGSHPPILGQLTPLIEGLLAHRSVRAFLPEALPEATLETLVAAAQSAATSSNLQLWSVVAVRDPARKAALAALASRQAFIREAPLFLVWLVDLARLTAVAAKAGQTISGPDYTEAFLTGVVDASLAAQNATVAAESLGLGAVYVGAIRNHIDQVAELLRLPSRVMPLFGMAIGLPDPAYPTAIKPRLPQSAVLHHEMYDAGPSAAATASYDQSLAAFWQSQSGDHPLWSVQATARLKDAAALRSRATIRAALAQRGFPLL